MEWKEYSLGDISKLKYGKNVSAKLCKGPVPIFSGYRKIGTCNTINCKKNTVIVIARGAGGCGDVKLTKEDCFLTNLSISVELDKGICNAKWFYYNHLLNNLSFLNSGSAQPQITIDSLSKYLIRIPPIIIQRKIAGILSALDSKIENNNKINANLEAQAQALFKSWFVDFTPFKDQPFVDSELGPIPQGWKVGKLGDIGEIVGGSTPSKSKPEYYTTHGIAWLTPKDLSTSKAKFTSRGEIDITDEGYNSTSTKLMPRGSVLFSSRAPIGYLTIAKNEICTNQGFKSLVPNGAGTGFIYYTLRHLTPQIENRATGSTFKEASATLMRSVETIVPPTSILNKFEELLRPILQFQEKKEEENQRLAALRDTLLPKLMSGEIKL
ncbi:MAG: restriction endonuclease subunit S [Bacteroidales bacterium]|nr:restriction endonuclease subunit S [Bacteroidales bacterium]